MSNYNWCDYFLSQGVDLNKVEHHEARITDNGVTSRLLEFLGSTNPLKTMSTEGLVALFSEYRAQIGDARMSYRKTDILDLKIFLHRHSPMGEGSVETKSFSVVDLMMEICDRQTKTKTGPG